MAVMAGVPSELLTVCLRATSLEFQFSNVVQFIRSGGILISLLSYYVLVPLEVHLLHVPMVHVVGSPSYMY
jgi:hypothetical protein